MDKAKPTLHASKGKQGIHSLFLVGGLELPPGKQGSLMCNADLGRLNATTSNTLSSFFFQLYILRMTPYGIEYPLGQLSWAVSPPSYWCTPRLLMGRVG